MDGDIQGLLADPMRVLRDLEAYELPLFGDDYDDAADGEAPHRFASMRSGHRAYPADLGSASDGPSLMQIARKNASPEELAALAAADEAHRDAVKAVRSTQKQTLHGIYAAASFKVTEILLFPTATGQRLRDFLCHDCDYCGLREKHKSDIAFCKTMFDALVSAKVSKPIPIATVAVYLVLDRGLDLQCRCQGKSSLLVKLAN